MEELFSFSFYKRNQGKVVRQVTAVCLLLILGYALWSLAQGPLAEVKETKPAVGLGIPFGLFAIGAWFIFRLMNYPPLADFLISVEAEMDKVTWVSKADLHRSTVVVLVTMIFLGLLLFVFDVFWGWFFRLIGFLEL